MKHSWNYNSIDKTCPVCSSKYTVPPNRLRSDRGKFCSKRCYIEDMKLRPGPFLGKNHSEESIEKNRIKHLGRKYSLETLKKRSISMKKTLNASKPVNKRENRRRLMGQMEYRLWRTAVYMRDDYTCQICNIKGGNLQADHIKPWSLYPELRYAIDNGRTLCVECHRNTDTFGNRIKKTDITLEGVAY